MTLVVLSIGSNLGDSPKVVAQTIESLKIILRGLTHSSIYETAPVGVEGQPDYFNAVVTGEWAKSPQDLWEQLTRLENRAQRLRTMRWGPRTLDIDMIAFGASVSTDADLTLPHPRAHERLFVLIPWAEIDSSAVLPGHGPIAKLITDLELGGATL